MDHHKLLQEIHDVYGDDTRRLLQDLAELSAGKKAKKAAKLSGEPLVTVTGATKTYKMGRNKVEALKGVSFTVHPGEIVALTGPSGSGKSTLLHLMAGLDRPTGGSVEVGGVRVDQLRGAAMARYRASKLGFVFQFFYLQPFLNLITNVKVPTMFVAMNESERNERAKTLIDAVGLGDRANHFPRELSGGQMQRAAIARALMNRPQLILADEPTGNLDSANAQGVMELFEKVRSEYGTSVIVVTHDPAVARQADRIIELKDGAIV